MLSVRLRDIPAAEFDQHAVADVARCLIESGGIVDAELFAVFTDFDASMLGLELRAQLLGEVTPGELQRAGDWLVPRGNRPSPAVAPSFI
jgi:hypothetical protein